MTFFAARQPILDVKRHVIGYELLFRDSMENVFPDADQDAATAKIIDEFQHHLGLNNLSNNKLAFVNFTLSSLRKGYPLVLDKERIVIEILESVKPDSALLDICINLKKQGYKIALDDYQHSQQWCPFLSIVDIIKVDFQLSTPAQVVEISEICKDLPNLALLAEKIETYDEFQCAADLGFSYFQGYFFNKPEMIKRPSLAPSQLSLARLVTLFSHPQPDINKMIKTVKADLQLSYRLLKFCQYAMAPQIAFDNIDQLFEEIDHIELQRYLSLLLTAQLADNKPTELTRMANHRAFFCEQVCALTTFADKQSAAFLVGMFSLLGAMLDADLAEVVSDLSLSQDIIQALLHKQGPLSELLNLCIHFEQGNWSLVMEAANLLGITIQQANDSYLHAFRLSAEHINASH